MNSEVWKARDYQKVAGKFTIKNRKCGLFVDMGLGKTAVVLTALQILLNEYFDIAKPLIIAPVRVVDSVWLQEAEKWQHINLKGIKVVGTPQQRIKALNTKADFYLISVDNVGWLVDYYQTAWPFDMVIVDESSKFKSHDSQRFRALKRVIRTVSRVIILTGTPAPNGLLDLWPQLYLLDGGERLEPMISHYRTKYFDQNVYSHRYDIKPGVDKLITGKIKDICISVSAKEHLKDLPDLIVNDVKLVMDDKVKRQYEEFKKEQVLLLKDKEITALNKAALGIKLLQFANGAVYDENKKWHNIHDLKLDALEEVIEEASGNNVLCAYNYQHDLEKIKKRFKFARQLKTDKDVQDWNNGKIPLLVMHPASGGHGLNLQFGGHIAVWYGLNWNLEYYLQFNKRILRPGQKNKQVILHRLLMSNTIDERVADILAGKDTVQNDLLGAVKLMIDEILNKQYVYRARYKSGNSSTLD